MQGLGLIRRTAVSIHAWYSREGFLETADELHDRHPSLASDFISQHGVDKEHCLTSQSLHTAVFADLLVSTCQRRVEASSGGGLMSLERGIRGCRTCDYADSETLSAQNQKSIVAVHDARVAMGMTEVL